ncbi:ABC transporter ATP-binding protein [Chthonobacter albigriseus]|uniref:ABC transporter ATP-binding protein n=1 Tax=Chthonobacter albigriseus TaxID=1683161 RepID=UPI0015EE8696|nr:ABC transporter ATP-binding protein [Chthonobacter albigriseus]
MNKHNVSVSVQDLSLSFGTLTILKQLNLDIQEGEFLVLLGPSGCGKSTLLNCIAGLLDITEGRIFIKGKNVTWAEPKDRGIGMVFQSYALYPQMTVERNLSFGLRVSGMDKAEIDKRVARAADILQIQPLLHRKPGQLSGGQRQRVAIGRALVRNVDVFLFDEPLSNLDAQLRAELRVEIKKLHHSLGNTMIYVTHDQIEAMTLADRIAVMKGGVIQQLDAPHEIYNRPVNRFVAGFLGSPAMTFLDGTITAANGGPAVNINGTVVPLGRYGFAGAAPEAGRPVTLGVRPEHIAVGGASPEPEADRRHWVTDKVTLLEPTGADTIVWSELGGLPITVRVDAEKHFHVGEPFAYGLDLTRASLFDKASGDRL